MVGEHGRQVPSPSMNAQAQSHEALKAMTDAADPAGSTAIAESWGDLAEGFDQATELFQRAMLSSEPGWTGEAADAMRAQLARIARWTKETGAAYRAAADAIGTQSDAAGSAKTAMPPPVPYDPAQMIRDAAASGNIFEMAALSHRIYAQKQKHDAAHAEAIRIVSDRDRTFGEAAGSVPTFRPPPSLTESPELTPQTDVVGPHRPRTPHPGRTTTVHSTPYPPVPDPTTSAAAAANPGATTPSGAAAPGAGPAAAIQGSAPIGTGATTPAPGFGGAPYSGFGPAGFGPGPAPVPPPAPRRDTANDPTGTPVKPEPKRPEYLLEPETHGMFGSNAVTAPPVIGET